MTPEFRELYDALAVIDREGFGENVDADRIIENAARFRLAELAVRDHLAEMDAEDIILDVPVPRIIARFNPQAWVNDYAIEVDPEGEQEWDATVAFGELHPDYRTQLVAEIDGTGEALDRHDALKLDPAAPAWVRDYRGPFDIRIRRETR